MDRPQRLGFLPTLWFWNDEARQSLVLPIVLAMSLPVTCVIFFVVSRFQLPVWLIPVVAAGWPYVVMGLVERRVRRELHRRSLRGQESIEVQVPAPDPPALAISSRRWSLVLMVLSGVATALAIGANWGGALVGLGVLALVLFVLGAGMLSRRVAILRLEAGGLRVLPPETRRGR